MVFGQESIVKEEPEWWISYDKYSGPYSEPDYITYDLSSALDSKHQYYIDIDKSDLKQIAFEYYKNYEPNDVITFDGKPYGWITSVMHDPTRGTTVEYQPY